MIASHYAEPLDRVVVKRAELRSAPDVGGNVIHELQPSERFALLDNSVGWAWGYAGDDRQVGYIRSDAIGS